MLLVFASGPSFFSLSSLPPLLSSLSPLSQMPVLYSTWAETDGQTRVQCKKVSQLASSIQMSVNCGAQQAQVSLCREALVKALNDMVEKGSLDAAQAEDIHRDFLEVFQEELEKHVFSEKPSGAHVEVSITVIIFHSEVLITFC